MGEVLKLCTGYEPVQEPRERPVSKRELADVLGVCTRTIDRWIDPGSRTRGRMPQDTVDRYGCWMQAGAHRRFFVGRVRRWLEDA